MAKTGRHTTSRRSSQSMYVDGNTVRKVQEVPVKGNTVSQSIQLERNRQDLHLAQVRN